jgi:hypothetical protein
MTIKQASFLERYFYLLMSLLIAVVVVFGFSHTIGRNLIHPRFPPPAILYLHTFVFSAWVLFFILQSALVRSHNVRLHRTLGWAGVGLGVLIVVLGWMTSIIMARLSIQHGSPFPFRSFLIIAPLDMLSFGIPFALAVYWRRRPDFHRRLMLIATCALLEAAFGRIPIFHLIFAPVGLDAMILLGVVRDIIVDRRIHKVYLYALPTMIVFQFIAEYTFVHESPWWIHIADYLLR